MKGIKLLLAVLLAPLAFQAAVADNTSEIARAATRQNTAGGITSTRQRGNATQQKSTSTSRTRNANKSGSTSVRERTTTTPRDGATTTRTAKTPEKNVSARNATKIQPRTIKTVAHTTQPRTTTTARVATKSRVATTTPKTRARNATAPATGTDVLNRDFSKCRTVFYDCMDEFCANKDSQLKRCACSARINEFDGTKRNLANVEEKLLDFSQRLLTVNMDKEDAMALYKPTEGELAYTTEDTSASKKMLDEIAKKLNTSFNDNNFDQGLNAISLSLNMDSAFDTVDSMAGASTAAKSGTDLYTSALPVCREMALEVCSSDDLAIAESSYQMAIESDCNTVKKSYQTQVDQAREQVFESGALLDISRLDIYQKRNSDDVLTCKRKMLDMLTDSTVCGTDMGKCLDTTGRYIDPTTGKAFLTTELTNLATLITHPETGQTWRTAPGNDRFVTFLNSKKKFLEPAMENCQDISDYVWDEFINDALAQIKLAQDKKLEEMRQSCTTLTTQCLTETYDSITEFDARALSIFGVAADKTVNAMCADVQTACTALMETSGGGTDWQSGMTAIATEKTYETILQTCREVGRTCIIQTCSSISGNFGLCENIDTSINRKSIINRSACWNEVVACIASAGADSLTKIQSLHALDTIRNSVSDTTGNSTVNRPNTFRTFYGEMYGITNVEDITVSLSDTDTITPCISNDYTNCVYDICTTECANATEQSPVPTECYICRLAERIWGNCEAPSNTELTNTQPNIDGNETSATYHNRIKTNADTLLAWFAENTGTDGLADSCRDTSCRPGYKLASNGSCVPPDLIADNGEACTTADDYRYNIYDDYSACCKSGKKDYYGKCCEEEVANLNNTLTTQNNDIYFGEKVVSTICVTPTANLANLVVRYTADNKTYDLICLGDITWTGDAEINYPNGKTVHCNGELVRIDTDGHYDSPLGTNGITVSNYYSDNGLIYKYAGTQQGNIWNNCGTTSQPQTTENIINWSIKYTEVCN